MAASNDTPDHPPVLRVGIELDGLTWRDLRAFVAICRDIPDNEKVGLHLAPDEYGWDGMEEWVHFDTSRLT